MPATLSPAFQRLSWANLMAQAAEQLSLAAAPLLAVLLLKAGPGEVGLLASVQSLPFLLLAIPLGLLADRSSRRMLMAVSEILRALALLLLVAALLADQLSIGLLAGVTSWHAALLVMAGAGLLSAAGFALLLPPSRGFQPRPAAPARKHLRRWAAHLRTPGLGALFTLGFLNLGVMVAAFNYLGFRLHAPPYSLSAAAISLIFLTYLLGSAASGWGGRLADRQGRLPLLRAGLLLSGAGLALTLLTPLPVIILGVTLITVGFFVTHSVASSSVGHLARRDKGHASALYLLAYYAGSSVIGGLAWAAGGWPLLVALCAALLLFGLVLIRRVPRT